MANPNYLKSFYTQDYTTQSLNVLILAARVFLVMDLGVQISSLFDII